MAASILVHAFGRAKFKGVFPSISVSKMRSCQTIVLRPIIFSAFLVYAFFLCCSGDGSESHFRNGLKSYRAGKFDEAIEHFKSAIRVNPYDEDAHTKLVDCYKLVRKLDPAIEYFEQVKQGFTENPYPPFALGLILVESEAFPDAIENLKHSIRLQPQFESNYKSLIAAYAKSQNLQAAIQLMQTLISSQVKNPYPYYGLAYAFHHKNNWDEALGNVDQSIRLNQNLTDAYHLKIKILRDMGRSEEALATGKLVLEMARERKDPDFEITILVDLGRAYWRLGENDVAIDHYEQALGIIRKLGLIEREAGVLNNIGVIYRGWGEYQKALGYYQQSLEIDRLFRDKMGESMTVSNVGDIYTLLAEYDSAMVCYEQSLRLAEESGDKEGVAVSFSSIASVNFYEADYDKAIEYGEKAMKMYRDIRRKSREALELGNLGTVYFAWGDYQKALDYYNQALVLSQELGEKYSQQFHLCNIGETYGVLGDYEKALENLNLAQEIASSIGDKSQEAACAGVKGTVFLAKGDTLKAVQELKQALAIFAEIGDRRNEAITCASLAKIHTDQKDFVSARILLKTALEIHEEIGTQYGTGETYNNLGTLHFKAEDYISARKSYENALAIGEEIKASKIVWESQSGLGDVYARQGNFSDALSHYKQAVETIESVRGRLISEEQKSIFFSERIEVYQRLIDQLYDIEQIDPNEPFDEEAFHYAERAKARALLDILTEARIDFKEGIDVNLKMREDGLFKKIAKTKTKLRDTSIDQDQIAQLSEKLVDTEKDLNELRLQLKKSNPTYADIQYPEPLTLTEAQENILDNDVLLEYFLGKEHSYLWCVARNQSMLFQLPGERTITEIVNSYLKMISQPPHPATFTMARGEELYNLLLKPADQILQGVSNLIIVPDGILHYLPFETLVIQNNDEMRYLVESFNISYAPSASVLGLLTELENSTQISHGKRKLLAFGDPVFGKNDQISSNREAYKERGFELDRLPYTALEVENIASYFPKEDRRIYLREQAREEAVKTEDLTDSQYLHFATHGLIDEAFPGRSCIVLTLDDDPNEDGYLQVQEIFNLRLAADLVTLSACQTGRGKFVRGEGFIGLTRAFLYAGAESILASLWSVNDQSTAKLMSEFYRLVVRGMPKTEALKRAKLEFIAGQNRALRHPFFWAAFVLIGNHD